MNFFCCVHGAGFGHSRKEKCVRGAAAEDRGTGKISNCFDTPGAVKAHYMVLFEGSIGGEIESICRRDGSHSARLLIARKNSFDGAEIARGAEDLALSAFIAGEDPEAIGPVV